MILENVSPIGSRVVAVLSSHGSGTELLRPSLGKVAVSNDGQTCLRAGDGEHYPWEIRAVYPLDSRIGRLLIDRTVSAASRIEQDSAIRAIEAAEQEDWQPNRQSIFKGAWCDTPWRPGFQDRPGIYLVKNASNSAFGSYEGGFPTVEAAEAFAGKHGLAGDWKVVDSTEHAFEARIP